MRLIVLVKPIIYEGGEITYTKKMKVRKSVERKKVCLGKKKFVYLKKVVSYLPCE